MHLQQLALCFATLVVGSYALPNEMPEAFNKMIVGRAVGGNCNFTGACVGPAGNDRGECIGESQSRCCDDTSFCSMAGKECEFDPANFNSPALCA